MNHDELRHKKILLIISGGIAAYKSLELIRLLKKNGAIINTVLTKGGAQFVTALSISSLSGNKTYADLWDLTDESEMGHIRLSRDHDLIVIAPASADLMAKMAHGLANDLASTLLLASDTKLLICPAMNPMMWQNQATQENVKTLIDRGFHFCGPSSGEMACGEKGLGRMSEPENILNAITTFFTPKERPLHGKKALVTSGPTLEAIDPVRYISNHSSGKQGHAIACALRDAGADVTLVTGPTKLPSPKDIRTIPINAAQEMHDIVHDNLPSDIAVCAAAVADWRVSTIADSKMKKQDGEDHLVLKLVKNPDILKSIGTLPNNKRPKLVVGFAAETDDLINNAQKKLNKKGCDMIVANHVNPSDPVFGKDTNQATLLSKNNDPETWSLQSKDDIAKKLVSKIINSMTA